MFGKARTAISTHLHEFREFAFKGNLIQLAIGVVLGAAFNDLVKAFVDSMVMPMLNLLTGRAAGEFEHWRIFEFRVGVFIAALIRFLIIAFAIYILMVKAVGWIVRLGRRDDGAPGEPTMKDCPFCLMSIPYKARKCGHCTADLPMPAPPGTLP